MKKLIQLLMIIPVLFSCKNEDTGDIFFVDVTNQNNNNYNYIFDYGIDLDRDGDNDMWVDQNEIYNDSSGTYIYSIEFRNQAGKDIQFVANDDCATFEYSGQEINENSSFEDNITLANTYAYPCNPNQGDEQYLGFRIDMDNEWHYGWIEIEYNLDYGVDLAFNGWAYHEKKNKAIWTGQTE